MSRHFDCKKKKISVHLTENDNQLGCFREWTDVQNELFDVTIVGGGPAGLYAAFYSGLREMKTKLIECQPRLGGKLHVYPEKMIWDVGGHVPISGGELIQHLVAQGLTFNPTVVLNEKVEVVTRDGEGIFVLETASGQKHYTKTVIVAVGSGIINPKKLPLEGADRFEGSNLHYAVPSIRRFQNKTVLISGGGNSAVDWAIELEPVAEKVYVVCRNGSLSAHEAQVTELLNSSVECIFHSKLTKLVAGDDDSVIERVQLTNLKTGDVFELRIDDVIVHHGYECDTSLLEKSTLPIRMVDNRYIAGSASSETSVDGLYAAGDILQYDGKVNLIAGAFQDAANAVNKAKQFIQPDASPVEMVSSHHSAFKERNRELYGIKN